jgi:UDP-N-acetylmuramate dehydrogenase
MNKLELHDYFIKFMDKENVLLNEPMKNHTSFKIGGPADLLVIPQNIEEIQRIISICRMEKAPFFIMGNGSNLLVRDKGLRCVVVKIAENLSRVTIKEEKVVAQAGVLLSFLSKKILQASLKGFEFASGIPGTLGGAVSMNAGAYGGEMKDVVESCKVISGEGELLEFQISDLKMGYRTSIIQEKNYIVVEVTLKLEEGNYEEIKKILDELTVQRTSKQPLHLPSAGSVFKRPPGYYAGKLIQDCNFKGVKIGGAQVSDLHSGFIVNVNNATAEDVIKLIQCIQCEVKKQFGVDLQTEVKIIGEQ